MNHSLQFLVILLVIGTIGQFSSAQTSSADSGEIRLLANFTSYNGSTVPVGIIVMQSGFVTDIGTEYSRAFSMVEQDNPDSCIRPIIFDGGSNVSVASSAWKSMMQNTSDLPIVVTVASWTTNVVYPEAAEKGMIQVALGSAVVNRTHVSDNLVRFTPGVEQEAPVLAAYLSQFSRIAIIGGDNDYTNGYFSALETLLPGKIRLKRYYNPNDPASTLNCSEIIQSNPDAIVLLSVSEGGIVAELLRKEGIQATLVGTRVIERNSLADIEAAQGLIFTTPALNESHPFFTRYFEKYGENPTFYGAEGFDAMTTLYAAVSACKDSPDCIYSWYQNRTYSGALGLVHFDESGVASYPIKLKIVQNGKFEDYQG